MYKAFSLTNQEETVFINNKKLVSCYSNELWWESTLFRRWIGESKNMESKIIIR